MANNQTDFLPLNLLEYTNALAQNMPGGPLYVAKDIDGTTLRDLVVGLSGEGVRLDNFLSDIAFNHNPAVTVDYIEEWEAALGIPDSCFPGPGNNQTLAERQRDLVVKFAGLNISNRADYIALAAKYGFIVEINNGIFISGWPVKFPWFFFGDATNAKFTMVVDFLNVPPPIGTFPTIFPMFFGVQSTNIIQCLYNKLTPLCYTIVYRFLG
jgi:hypothetical protein